jgi:hypothetical protein
MRTQEEIVRRIEDLKDSDFFGFQRSDLTDALDYEHAKSFLKEAVPENEWEQSLSNDEDVRTKMINYMEFAWDKANNCRGLSAGRSMSHYKAWTWLLGDEVFNQFDDLEDYQYYGKDNLVQLCVYLGLDSAKWDDNRRTNTDD